uniref:Uncharacterized protein n=1 Tax=Arundo donax TaxID=35708 RepID=A0A0A8Z699_ARUDO
MNKQILSYRNSLNE